MSKKADALAYAQKQLRAGTSKKQLKRQLENQDYTQEQIDDIIAQATRSRTNKKRAYIALLAIAIPLLTLAVINQIQPATPAQTTTPAAQQPIDAEALMIQAVANNNASLCERLDERRQECLAEVNQQAYEPQTRAERLHAQAQETGNTSLCRDITNASMRETCLADMQ